MARFDQSIKALGGGAEILRDVLERSKPRPPANATNTMKTAYAVRFAENAASHLAKGLGDHLKDISASNKKNAQSERKKQQLDINFSTPALGLALGISLKSVHIPDQKSGRYTHNTKRNLEELRIEAFGYHKRQPYAVMIAVLFIPIASCNDGKKGNPSSFGAWVKVLRPYAGRRLPDGDLDVFEKIFIALYDPDGSELAFFDVQTPPPKNSRPQSLMTYPQFLEAALGTYKSRNSVDFKWADGTDSPRDLTEEPEDDDDDGA